MSASHRALCRVALASSITFAAGVAAAQEPPAAQRTPGAAVATERRSVTLNEEGAAYYRARDYRRAVEKFIQAYAIDDDPNLLFNIASCYEKLGDPGAAIEKYRAFLDSPAADPQGIARAQRAIERASAPRPASAPTSSAPAAETTDVAAAPPKATRVGSVGAEASDSSTLLPWVTLGGGAVLTVGGAALYWLGTRDHSRVTESDGFGDREAVSSMTRAEANELVDSGSTKKWIGAGAITLGGAAMASYLVLWLLDQQSSSSATEAALGISPDGSTSLWLSGRF